MSTLRSRLVLLYKHISYNTFTFFSSYVQSGESPLWIASFSGHHTCVELLINASAIVDIPSEVSVVHTSQRPLATEPPHVPSTGSWCMDRQRKRFMWSFILNQFCAIFLIRVSFLRLPRNTFMLCPMHTSQSPTHNHAPWWWVSFGNEENIYSRLLWSS